MAVAKSGQAGIKDLALLADLERPVEEPIYLKRCLERYPSDPLVQLGVAAQELLDGSPKEASRRLKEVIANRPDLIAAHAILGEIMLDENDVDFRAWHSQLPPEADTHPDIWYVRGVGARRKSQLKVAAYCFWQALRCAPTHRRACYQLGQTLVALGDPSGDEYAGRAAKLAELTRLLDEVLRTQAHHEPPIKQVTLILEQTGRTWEACAWANAAAATFPEATWANSMLQRLTPVVKNDPPRTLNDANLALKHDLSRFPNHRQLFGTASTTPLNSSSAAPVVAIHFASSEAGLDFVYNNGADPSTKGARMQEQTGGGVSVLDYDLDGWSDLFFSQGGEWKSGSTRPTQSFASRDQLFRNVQEIFFSR